MIFLLTPFLTALLPGLIGAAGSIFSRAQSRGDIARQNAYNSPAQQLKRLREAGLPNAAALNQQASQQSSLPQTSGEGLGRNLGSFISTQTQLQQLAILKEEARLKGADADLKEAEREYLLSHKGEDIAGTNLTNSLKTKQGIEGAELQGKHLANKILGTEAGNIKYKTGQENQRRSVEIANMLHNNRLIGEHIKGAELQNRINNVIAQYQPNMSAQQLNKLILENGLIGQGIEGKKLQNAFDRIRNIIEENTMGAVIMGRGAEAMIKSIAWERAQEEFNNYKEYQKFVDSTQEQIRRTPWESVKDPMGTLENIMSFVYTSITGTQGQGTSTGNLLNFIK